MKIYLLRHANADWPAWSGSDRERPLTEKGCEQARRIAKFLKRTGAQPGIIATSPLKRTAQTAAFVGEEFDLRPVGEPLLEPGFGKTDFVRVVKRHPVSELLLVGHEPDLSEAVGFLTGGRVKMVKAGLACIESGDAARDWQLLWFVTPKLIKDA